MAPTFRNITVMRIVALLLLSLLPSQPALAACEGRTITENVLAAPLCVPADPQRIVVLDPAFSLGMALELDAKVVGAPLFGMSDEILHAKAQERGVADIGSVTEPSIERIIALKPDLILGSGFMAAPYHEMLSKIAPTALVGVTDWKTYFATVAAVTGQGAKMAGMFDAYDRRIAEIRPKIPDVKVSVVRITSWDFQVYLDAPLSYAPFTILHEAGVKRTPYETSDGEMSMKRPDWEELGNLDGDILLYIVGGTNDSDKNGRHEEVIGNPLWQMLPAVQAGRVHRVDPAIWMEFSGLGSANRVLDDIERYIVGKE